MPPASVAVAFGGPSPEHDVSILTGLQACRALADTGAAVTALYWSKTGEWHRVDAAAEAAAFVDGVPRDAEALRLVLGDDGGFVPTGGRFARPRPLGVEVVVNCCHGGPGEDGSLQGAWDLAGLAYTGPDVAGAAVGMDKLAFAGLMEAAGLPSLPRRRLDPDTDDVGFAGPYIVKPRFGGSSIGVEVVPTLGDARALLAAVAHYRRGAVVEPYRPDLHDLNIGLRSWPELALSAIERPLRSSDGAEILGYADKYMGGEGMASAPRELPAAVDDETAGRLREVARTVAGLCGVRGVARLDFLAGGGELYVNEINTVPGSLARYLWVEPTVAFARLLEDMVEEARRRPTARHSALGADGAVLRAAGSIAGKLA